MQDLSQIRTNAGTTPCKQIELLAGDGTGPNDGILAFEPYTAIELRHMKHAQTPFSESRHAGLIELASCIQPTETGYKASLENLLDFAGKTGPLFGVSATESVRSWLYASRAALVAVMLQEFLNDPDRALRKVQVNTGLQKIHITAQDSSAHFDMYSLTIAADQEYASYLNRGLFTRRIETDAKVYYAFVAPRSTETTRVDIDFSVFAFEDEISNADFRALCELLQMDDETAREVQKNLKLDETIAHEVELGDSLSQSTVINPELASLTVQDADPVRALLQALVVFHLFDVSLDAFQGDGSTGYLVFKNYLTCLWFDFSQKLSTVRIGYCQECGRPFSLAGHRGLARHYCSERCKTAAKNERTKQETETARKLFEQGKSVPEISTALERSESAVREQLSKWTELKHALADEIDKRGFASSPLFKRCVKEKLDLKRLLSKQKNAELKEYLKLRS